MLESIGKVAYRSPRYRKVMPKDLDDASHLYVVSIVRGWIDAGNEIDRRGVKKTFLAS